MPLTPSTRWSPGKVLSIARQMVGDTQADRVDETLLRYYYNLALSDIVGALSATLDPTYFASSTLTTAVAARFINNTPSTVPSAGNFTAAAATYPNIQVGMTAVLAGFTSGTTLVNWAEIKILTATLATGTWTCTYSVLIGTDPFAGSTSWKLLLDTGDATDITADISAIKYDKIIAIEDSNNGYCRELSNKDFSALSNTNFLHSSYADDIVYTVKGNTIVFKIGPRVTNGTKTIYYQRQPDYPTNYNDSEYIDLADKYAGLLVKRITTYCKISITGGFDLDWSKALEADLMLTKSTLESEMMNRLQTTKSIK